MKISLAQQFHNTLTCFGAELLDKESDLYAFWKPKVAVSGDRNMIVALLVDGSIYVRGGEAEPFYYILADEAELLRMIRTEPLNRVWRMVEIVAQAIERHKAGGSVGLEAATFMQGNMTLN